MSIEHILECVRKTNHEMTRQKLIEELSKCRYSAIALAMACENDRKSACVGEQAFYYALIVVYLPQIQTKTISVIIYRVMI